MDIAERRDAIFNYILKKNSVTITELKDKFGISLITVHRDLDHLDNEGYIRKVRGGAEVNSIGNFEKSLLFRATQNIREKKMISSYAANFIRDGMTILFDNSTTVLTLMPYLVRFKNLTIITYFEDIIAELSKSVYDCKLVCLGGDYSRVHRCYVGPFVDEKLTSIHVDAAFISAAALNPVFGIMQHYSDECNRKQLIINASDETNLLIDNSKIMKKALFTIAPLSKLNRMITNAPLDDAIIKQIQDTGIELHLVSPAQE